MATVKKHDAAFEKYPAFEWVHSLNPKGTNYAVDSKMIWYLPARNELKPIFASGNEDKQEKVGQTLKALGMEQPFFGGRAWFSTEAFSYSQQRAHFFNMLNGVTGNSLKTDANTYVWPIMAF